MQMELPARIAATAAACFFLFTSACQARQQAAQTASDSVTSPFFGNAPAPLSSHLGLAFPGSDPTNYDYVRKAGIGVVRLVASWDRIEPRRGQFDWRPLDRRILTLQRLGIEPFITFESDAAWAITADKRGKVKNGAPRDLNNWAMFVDKVVERYNFDGRNDAPGLLRPIKYYQAANEWVHPTNPSGGWLGNASDLIAYINIAHDTVKRRSPEANFVMGGIASTNLDIMVNALGVTQYEVRQLNNDGAMRIFSESEIHGPGIKSIIENRVKPVLANARYDYLDVHLYGPADRDTYRIAAIRQFTPGKPVLSSECGGPSLDYGNGVFRRAEHFFAVTERNLGILAEGLPYCLWFRLGETKGGTLGNSKTPLFDQLRKAKPGFYAYQMLAALLRNTSSVELVSNDVVKTYRLLQQQGAPIEISWRSDHKPLALADLSTSAAPKAFIVGPLDQGGQLITAGAGFPKDAYFAISGPSDWSN